MATTGDPSFGTQVQVRSNTVDPATFVTIEGVGDIDGPALSMGEVDTTSHSTGVPIRTLIPGLIDPGTLSFPCFFNPSDPTHSFSSNYGLEKLFYDRKVTQWRLINTDAGHRIREFDGFVRELSESYPLEGVNTRDTTIRISGKMRDVAVVATFTPTSAAPTAAGGAASFTLTVDNTELSWSPVSDAAWITITSPTGSSTGNGTVNYTVATNSSGSSRVGHITVGSSTFTVTQAA